MSKAAIIGGGLAGTALAIHLARAGRDVTLFERTTEAHHKVCGEFLSQEAVQSLYHLGLNLPALGAVPIEQVRFGSVQALLPFAAQSLSRFVLDEALLRQAAALGVSVVRGHRITSLADVNAKTVFLATGKHDLPRYPRSRGIQANLVGFKMHFRLRPEQLAKLQGAVELTPFAGGYCGLQCIEGGLANLCLLAEKQVLKSTPGHWAGLLQHARQSSPQLQQRLSGARAAWSAPLAIAPIPYGFRQRTAEPYIWPLGDQAAVIPSFAGNGMSIALRSAALAAHCYLQGATSPEYLKALDCQVRNPVRLATRLSQLLVRPGMAYAGQSIAALWPGLLTQIATRTRLPSC